ncbi:MAG TPA: MOSC domain-containing protein [Acidimicrobiales bacterium]|nr:MOSC domain-containing protein [Acidimicrobiales bacterium]
MDATVFQLNVSGGGVPKLPVPEIDVRADGSGVVGDVQKERKHHGRPWQALCLWSLEIIESLQSDGHPITAGSAGENVTIQGVEWKLVRPGVRLAIGDEVICEITVDAEPCKKQTPWFTDGDWSRLDDRKHPGRARMYAAVIEGGTIRTGDRVEILRPKKDDLNARWGGW